MSILDRGALEQSPLADLHTIASELSIDSFRRLRKAELIDAILARQSGAEPEGAGAEESQAERSADGEPEPRRRRWRRGGRERDDGPEGEDGSDGGPQPEGPAEIESEIGRAERDEAPPGEVGRARSDQDVIDGVVELLPGGSGFVRVHPPEPSDDDVYISSAQVKRCELISGDRVSGPRRAPRRSERFASLVRVDTVNGRPASELADSVRFDDRAVAFPAGKLGLTGDPLTELIDRIAPIGRGSRVTISGPAASGKTRTLRRLAETLSADAGLQLWLVLTGVRPEELPEWQQGPVTPAVALSFAASSDTQSQALDGVVEQVRRLVARGADAVILVDTLDGVTPSAARKTLASARNLQDGGSLTVIATSSTPLGGETTVIALEPRGGANAAPVVAESHSWTIRPELLG
jgi:transcription termination factor Rho